MASSSAERVARIQISISIHDEAVKKTSQSISTVSVVESSKRVMLDNQASFSDSLSESSAHEIGGSVVGYGSFNTKHSSSLTTSAANSWQKISDVSKSSSTRKEFASETMVEYVPDTIQIYAIKKTIVNIDGAIATDQERIHLMSGKKEDIGALVSGARSEEIRKKAWHDVMQLLPPDDDVDVVTFSIKLVAKKDFALVTWTPSETRAGTDAKSGAKYDLAYHRPSGSYMGFGDSDGKFAVPAVKASDLATAIKSGVVAENMGWTQIWTDKGSGNSKDYAVYLPIAPPGFVPLGAVCVFGTSGVKEPSHKVLCVDSSHPKLTKSGGGTWAWSDEGSRARHDLVLVRRPHGLLWPTKATLIGSVPQPYTLRK